MENASKALLMAAGVLIGVLVLSLAVFLFTDFGSKASKIYDRIQENQLTQYNAQYTVYSGREDITIYDIITVANKAKQNNEDYKEYTDFENIYKVRIIFIASSDSDRDLQDAADNKKQILIEEYNDVDINGNLSSTFNCKRCRISF